MFLVLSLGINQFQISRILPHVRSGQSRKYGLAWDQQYVRSEAPPIAFETMVERAFLNFGLRRWMDSKFVQNTVFALFEPKIAVSPNIESLHLVSLRYGDARFAGV